MTLLISMDLTLCSNCSKKWYMYLLFGLHNVQLAQIPKGTFEVPFIIKWHPKLHQASSGSFAMMLP